MPAIQSRRAFLMRTATASAAGLPASHSWTQPRKFPSQAIQFISSSSSGSAIDILSRRLSEHFTKVLGAAFVTNITGGGGVIATKRLIASLPDSHTLQVIPPSHIIIPLFNPDLTYNALTQVTPICEINTGCSILVARPGLEFNTVAGMVRDAKARPGKLNFGSPGCGTASDCRGAWCSTSPASTRRTSYTRGRVR